ncbi:hypothetical protein BDK51DRAFT_53032 [Blyttiomyces helicus]|uniref:Uncharacterized protein n=1 Tax=Blyttiomyces helicus TaxID=388810 RepID=A0A4P9WIR3_9FUNG|nr:hypothetical protein BDK51DRAFT_53032 [Blyttiomyces helicus]|eukprot:RKO92771.1 hypothetical protein BDK51DRAFT_53032 [Blyttiomyces helicus]
MDPCIPPIVKHPDQHQSWAIQSSPASKLLPSLDPFYSSSLPASCCLHLGNSLFKSSLQVHTLETPTSSLLPLTLSIDEAAHITRSPPRSLHAAWSPGDVRTFRPALAVVRCMRASDKWAWENFRQRPRSFWISNAQTTTSICTAAGGQPSFAGVMLEVLAEDSIAAGTDKSDGSTIASTITGAGLSISNLLAIKGLFKGVMHMQPARKVKSERPHQAHRNAVDPNRHLPDR